MGEGELEHILAHDFSVGTEDFREALLARCLEILDAQDNVRPLGIEELNWLCAAGDPFAVQAGDTLHPTPGT